MARDRGDKFYEYQEGSVREYWMFDPRPGKERVDFYVLDEHGRYQPVPVPADGVYLNRLAQFLAEDCMAMDGRSQPSGGACRDCRCGADDGGTSA